MNRAEAIATAKWACRFAGRYHIRGHITRLHSAAEAGDRPWSDLANYLLEKFPDNPALADGVFNG